VLSKWGKGLFTAKKPTTRVTMSKGKEVIEPIPDPAVGASQHSINHPLSETTTIISADGKTLVYPKEDEGVDYNPSSDDDGTEGKPHDSKAEVQERPAMEVPVQPATSTAVALHQPGSHAVSNQPKSSQPSTQHTAFDKDGRISPLSDANFNPSGISSTQYEKIKQVYGQMLDGYRSPSGSLINMDALLMVGFAAIQPSMAAQSQHNMSMLAKQQQVFMEEQNEMVRTSTAKLLLAQEELANLGGHQGEARNFHNDWQLRPRNQNWLVNSCNR
jgi:hypothetical protein